MLGVPVTAELPPVAYRVKCGALSRRIEVVDSGKCSRVLDREGNRCGGLFRSALREDDWVKCVACHGVGRMAGERCGNCGGIGWALMSTPR